MVSVLEKLQLAKNRSAASALCSHIAWDACSESHCGSLDRRSNTVLLALALLALALLALAALALALLALALLTALPHVTVICAEPSNAFR